MGIVVEAPIPRHITGIYVFTVVNLLAMLCISRVDAEIIVKDTLSNETAARYPDLQAKFGPDFPDKGLEGRLVYAEPDSQACGSLKPPPSEDNKYHWILLVARGGNCQFADKVLNAQLHNYSAVIVHNYEHKDGRIPMGGGNNGSRVNIPSTFVGWTDGMDLRQLYDHTHFEYIIRILEDESIDFSGYLWPFLLVLAICILMVMIFLLLKFLRDHASRRLSRLSNKHLKKIPVRKFKKGDYYDTCAICLEEYEEGEKIRVLPCDHVYHRKCIDPWLTKNKKTCPVCKRRVIPGRDADSESGSEAEQGVTASEGTETTPLLRGRPAQPNSQQSAASISGTTVVPPLQENGTFMPPDSDVEHGAVGGVGISDRSRQATVTQIVSGRGNIQNGDEKREVHSERKRKKHDRESRKKKEEKDTGQREEEAAGTSLVSEMRGHRERRKRRKDKKRAENRSSLSEGREREKDENRSERNAHKKEDSSNGASGLKERNDVQARFSEENEQESYSNPGFSVNHEVVMPAAEARRRELNEVV